MKKKQKINRALVPKEPHQSGHLNIVIMCPEAPGTAPGGGRPTLPVQRTTSTAMNLSCE